MILRCACCGLTVTDSRQFDQFFIRKGGRAGGYLSACKQCDRKMRAERSSLQRKQRTSGRQRAENKQVAFFDSLPAALPCDTNGIWNEILCSGKQSVIDNFVSKRINQERNTKS